MAIANISKKSLAVSSGVPLTTLDRKLRGHTDFTARELAMIAIALKVPFAQLLPDELKQNSSADASGHAGKDAA